MTAVSLMYFFAAAAVLFGLCVIGAALDKVLEGWE